MNKNVRFGSPIGQDFSRLMPLAQLVAKHNMTPLLQKRCDHETGMPDVAKIKPDLAPKG